MILSLTVYTGTALLMAWLGWHVSHREQRVMSAGGRELPFLSWEIVIAMLFYVAVSAVRWLTTWDYNMYYSFYVSIQSLGEYSRDYFEPGFDLVTRAMATSGLHFAFFFAFWAAVHIVLLYYALRHRKMLLPWIALFIFLGPYYVQWMSTLRQAVVECLFVLMVELIVKRKFWWYLACTLLAVTIHKMSILLILLYFVPLIPLRNVKRWIPYTLLAICVVLGAFPQWIHLLFDHLGKIAQVMGYGHYYKLFMTNEHYAFRFSIGPSHTFPLLIGVIIVWYYPAIKRMFSSDKCLSPFYRFSLLYLGYTNLMANTTQYLSRPGDLMRACFLIMSAYAACYLWRERKWVMAVLMVVLNVYYIYYEIAKAVLTPASIYTPTLYQSFLFN